MKVYQFVIVLLIALAFMSCQREGGMVTTPQASSPVISKGSPMSTSSAPLPQSVVLSGFTVQYNGRTLSGGQTTFSYTVTGPATQMSFRLEDPSCAGLIASWVPTSGKHNSNDATINPGLEWSPSVGSGTTNTFQFSVTYPGTVREGIVLAGVKSNSVREDGFIAGACARIFDIGGVVYTDGDRSASRGATETGISGVTVQLCDAFGAPLASGVTDAAGSYLFDGYAEGNYIVKVDTNSLVVTKTTYLEATTALSANVTIGPNSLANDFGFAAKSDKLVNDLKLGTLQTTGFNSGFWKKQVQSAISGSGNPTYSRDTVLAFIGRIRPLLLGTPYQLGAPLSNGLSEALAILAKPIRSDLDLLNQQLLTLEFNHVAGKGIVNSDPALQLVLIGWGEGLVAAAGGTPLSGITPMVTSTTTYAEASGVYSGINKSSGGGGTQ
jgi:hypothetical protein